MHGAGGQPTLCQYFGSSDSWCVVLSGSCARSWRAGDTLAVLWQYLMMRGAAGRLCTELEGSQVLWGVVQGSPQDWQRTAWHQPDSQGPPTPSPSSMAALQRMGGSGPLTPPPVQPPSTALHTSLRCACSVLCQKDQ